MLERQIIRENWLTRKPGSGAILPTMILSLIVVVLSAFYLKSSSGIQNVLVLSGDRIFNQSEYWRLWTALFIHADLGHLFSNLAFFIPLSFLLMSYYKCWFFPIVGFLTSGLMNIVVLRFMPPQVELLGLSGLVNWQGSAWLTLFLLIDKRHSLLKRSAHVIFLTVMLYIPERYNPNISYMSHLLGYIFGALSALIYYLIMRNRFEAAVVTETVIDEE